MPVAAALLVAVAYAFRSGPAALVTMELVSLEDVGAHTGVTMRWVGNADRCVGIEGGLRAAVRVAHLKLVNCHGGDALVFSVPSPKDPRIHLVEKPGLCVDNPGLTELQLWDCDDTKAKDNMNFFLRSESKDGDRTRGSIRPFKNRSMCMDCPHDELGAPVQMWECVPGSDHELFMLHIAAVNTTAPASKTSHTSKTPGDHHGAPIAVAVSRQLQPRRLESSDRRSAPSAGVRGLLGMASSRAWTPWR